MSWEPLRETQAFRHGKPVELDPDTTFWVNDLYLVHRKEVPSSTEGQKPMFHLSIRNQDHGADHDWRNFQRMKNQLAGDEYEAVEIYPAESRKVDTANQYHLWCFPFTFGFGLSDERMVTNHSVTRLTEKGAIQRDNEAVDGPLNSVDEAREWADRYR